MQTNRNDTYTMFTSNSHLDLYTNTNWCVCVCDDSGTLSFVHSFNSTKSKFTERKQFNNQTDTLCKYFWNYSMQYLKWFWIQKLNIDAYDSILCSMYILLTLNRIDDNIENLKSEFLFVINCTTTVDLLINTTHAKRENFMNQTSISIKINPK